MFQCGNATYMCCHHICVSVAHLTDEGGGKSALARAEALDALKQLNVKAGRLEFNTHATESK
eukprot:3796256-Amphidinium_carterae.3